MKLIASAQTIEKLESLLKGYFFSPNISINKDNFEISNSKGVITGYKIKQEKNRFKIYEL